jgi:hypothetical protein
VCKQQKKVVPAPKGGLGLVALGTDQGTISVWDLTRGVVAVKLGVVSEGHGLGYP